VACVGSSRALQEREEEVTILQPNSMMAQVMRRQLLADLALVGVAAVWGGTFVMVKEAVQVFPVFAFLAVRFALATLTLIPLRAWLERRFPGLQSPVHGESRSGVKAGVLLGLALMAGYGFQTVGLRYTTPAKAGFITGLSVVLVPAMAALYTRRLPPPAVVWGVLLATGGLALLSLNADLRPEYGDVLVFFCALSFAGHILLTGRLAQRHAPLALTQGQLATTAVLSSVISGLGEWPWPSLTGEVLAAALFTGLFASAVAFGVQTVAQRFTSPAHTALIFSSEPVFAALFSVLLGAEPLTPRLLVGGTLIVLGMVVAEMGEDWGIGD